MSQMRLGGVCVGSIVSARSPLTSSATSGRPHCNKKAYAVGAVSASAATASAIPAASA
jgi:hypothetical protein